MGKLIATTQATLDGVVDPSASGYSRTETTARIRSSARRDPAASYWGARRTRAWPASGPAKRASGPT